MGRKTEFYLTPQHVKFRATKIIIQKATEREPVHINVCIPGVGEIGYIKGKELESLAKNILKALGSKKLAFSQRYNSKTFFAKKKKRKP